MRTWIVLVALFGWASAKPHPHHHHGNAHGYHNNHKHNTTPSQLIVGGSTAPEWVAKYQLGITTSTGRFFCGAVWIDDGNQNRVKILTAAHCMESYKSISAMQRLRVYFGELQMDKFSNMFNPSTGTIHSGYSSTTFTNDLAILIINKPWSDIQKNANQVVPAPIKLIGESYAGKYTECYVSGWGTTREGGSLSNQLLYVKKPIVSWSDCQRSYAGELDSTMMCSGVKGSDACQGDSGGPLVVENSSGERFLAGIVSWGYGCARDGYPGVYADVYANRQWIANTYPA
jgi:secreted trypsin-like serine protease